MRTACFIIATIIVAFACFPAHADKSAEIKALQQKLNQAKVNKDKIARNLKTIEKDLSGTKNALVKTAESIQKNEKELQTLDKKIIELQTQQTTLKAKLDKDRGSIASLILALERINRMPPEALIMRPETPFKTAQSAMLLKQIIPSLNQQAADLKITLAQLQDIDKDLTEKRASAAKKTKTLTAKQKELNELVDKRKTLFASTNQDLQAEQNRAKEISSQAKSLQDLVARLEIERKAKAAQIAKEQSSAENKTRLVGLTPPKAGQPRLPLPGVIVTAYNEKDNFGAPSKGIDIEGRAGALVVAPMGGIVQFSGYFKNYGNMIILEHENGWHSLVAGLENLDTNVGQRLDVGEPLGVLHKSSSGQKPVLYYELRYNGKAVNPAKKFGDLS